MKERNEIAVPVLVFLFLASWLGFAFHHSPRFAGSLAGGILSVTGSALMLVPLAYLIIKRIKPLRTFVTARVPMRALLKIHIYAGVIGPILVILHTGHKFESHLGIALTAMTLIVVLSGFTGQYLMSHFSQTIREKQAMLTDLELAYRQTAAEFAATPEHVTLIEPWSGFFGRLFAGLVMRTTGATHDSMPVSIRALRLSESIADVEYAIRTHEAFKRAFNTWLKVHIVLSFSLYTLLGLHVWAAIHFGLRWFA